METKLISLPVEQVEADALVVVDFEKENGESPQAPNIAGGWIEDLYRSGEFKGKLLETALLHRPTGLKAVRLLVVGGGKRNAFGPAEMRKIAGAALRLLKPKGARSICTALPQGFSAAGLVSAAVEGAILGDYEPDRYKTANAEDKKSVDT